MYGLHICTTVGIVIPTTVLFYFILLSQKFVLIFNIPYGLYTFNDYLYFFCKKIAILAFLLVIHIPFLGQNVCMILLLSNKTNIY